MIKIVGIQINRYRSILSLDFDVVSDSNLVSICGKNNVGKTNTLKAIRLFFQPNEFNYNNDVPTIKKATGGQSVYPKITITFFDDSKSMFYSITRTFKNAIDVDIDINNDLTGYSYSVKGKSKVNKKTLTDDEINAFLKKIYFVYIDSVNVFLPDLIDKITDDMISVQYDRARFSETKKALKVSYDNYVDGLQKILDTFAKDISTTFLNFNSDWKIKFSVPRNSDTVKDLISNDVSLLMDDNGSFNVQSKGAGLQRLTAILLYFEMIKRLKNRKEIILCIDEPDVFLHDGLQKKLKILFDDQCSQMQIFYTTHSKIFINQYNMKNVFLLDTKIYEKYSVRKSKNIPVTETVKIDLSDDEGYKKICSHLGIEQMTYDILDAKNLLVEGNCDKKYIVELGNYYGCSIPKIISMNGADNALKYLEFYDSFYQDSTCSYKPTVRVVLDNDAKGREIASKIQSKAFNNILTQVHIIQNFGGNAETSLTKNTTNNEIEDLLYPELICLLINKILKMKKMNPINVKKVCSSIVKKSFCSKGILSLCEHEKNDVNPDDGNKISFVSSGNATNRFKESMAGLFSLEANKELLDLTRKCELQYPKVKEEVFRIVSFD